jgi:hypothetical protein
LSSVCSAQPINVILNNLKDLEVAITTSAMLLTLHGIDPLTLIHENPKSPFSKGGFRGICKGLKKSPLASL